MKLKEKQEKTAQALPKINVPPPVFVEPVEKKTPSEPKFLLPAFPDESFETTKTWDPRFAGILIVLVVIVNITLAVLFSGDKTESPNAPPPPSTKAMLVIEEPDANETPSNPAEPATETFVSPEDKRVLLKELTTVPPVKTTPAASPQSQENEERHKEIMSIINQPRP